MRFRVKSIRHYHRTRSASALVESLGSSTQEYVDEINCASFEDGAGIIARPMSSRLFHQLDVWIGSGAFGAASGYKRWRSRRVDDPAGACSLCGELRACTLVTGFLPCNGLVRSPRVKAAYGKTAPTGRLSAGPEACSLKPLAPPARSALPSRRRRWRALRLRSAQFLQACAYRAACYPGRLEGTRNSSDKKGGSRHDRRREA